MFINIIVVLLSIIIVDIVNAESQVRSEELKERILSWSESLHSFSGEYTLWDERFGDEGTSFVSFRIVYRQRGSDLYVETYPTGSADHDEFSYSTLNGKSMFRMRKPGQETSSGTIGATSDFKLPHGAYILPAEVYGYMLGMTLRERVQSGLSKVFIEGDDVLFSQRTEGTGNGMDFWFDSDLKLVRMEWITWSDPDEEVMKELPDIDRMRVGFASSTFEFDSFIEENGARFPTTVIRRDYSFDPQHVEPIYDAYRKGEISLATLYTTRMRIAQEGKMREVRRLTFSAEPTLIKLNPELDDSQFLLTFPEGARVGDLSKLESRPMDSWRRSMNQWWMHERSSGYTSIRVAILALSLAGILIASVSILRRRRSNR